MTEIDRALALRAKPASRLGAPRIDHGEGEARRAIQIANAIDRMCNPMRQDNEGNYILDSRNAFG